MNEAASLLARDEEERIGFGDLDDDHVDLELDDESDSEHSERWNKANRRSYHDDFTDNDSDGYPGEDDTFGLHSHVQSSRKQ